MSMDKNGLVWRTYGPVDDGTLFVDDPCAVRLPDIPPLIVAIRLNKLAAFRKLLDDPKHLKHINKYNGHFNPPLVEACSRAKTEYIKVLLESKYVEIAPPGRRTGLTPFHVACRECDLEVIEFVIKRLEEDKEADVKCFVNMTTNRGQTPLHFAARGINQIDVVRYLLKLGAYAVVSDDFEKLPCDYCRDPHVKKLLKEAQDEQLKELEEAESRDSK